MNRVVPEFYAVRVRSCAYKTWVPGLWVELEDANGPYGPRYRQGETPALMSRAAAEQTRDDMNERYGPRGAVFETVGWIRSNE